MHSVSEEYKTKSTYNGWSNRETWMVNLWMTNEECYYYKLCDILKSYETVSEQAEQLEEYVHFIVESVASQGLVGDMLTSSLGRVDWLEIIESNLE